MCSQALHWSDLRPHQHFNAILMAVITQLLLNHGERGDEDSCRTCKAAIILSFGRDRELDGLSQGCYKKADMSTGGSPGGKRRATTNIGNDLPYPVGTAPIRCWPSSSSVAAQMISAWIQRGVKGSATFNIQCILYSN